MRKPLLLFLAFFTLTITVFAQDQAKLTGKITNPKGNMVYLSGVDKVNDRFKVIELDSAKLDENGKFEMTAKIDKSMKARFEHGDEMAEFLLAPGDELDMHLNTAFFDESLEFTGKGSGKNNAIMVLYLLEEANTNALFQKADYAEDTVGIFKEYDMTYEPYLQLIRDYQEDYPAFADEGRDMLLKAKDARDDVKAFVISDFAFKAFVDSLNGKQATDIMGIDLEGNEASLSDYKGKVTVVDFWATWCGPCRMEFPAYKELEEQYGKDVNFVSIATWCKEKEWKKMAMDEGFQHNIYIPKEKAAQLGIYKVEYIPRYMVLDADFKILDANAPRPSSGKLQDYFPKN